MLNHSSEHAVSARGSATIRSAQGGTDSEEPYETNWGFIGKGFGTRFLNPSPISQHTGRSDAKIGWRPIYVAVF